MPLPEMSRRAFLFLTGGTGVGSIVDPGRKAVNKLIPWVIPPEHIRPGEWTHFATTCRECPAGCGMHVRHRDGRPQKAEGNPIHPVNRGGLCARGQSSLQGIYDPDRVRYVLWRGNRTAALEKTDWATALGRLGERLEKGGGRVAILSDLQTGTLAEVMTAFIRSFGSDRLLFYEVFNYEPLRSAHREIFGQSVIPLYQLDRSDFILCFGGAEFLETWVSPVGMAYDFSRFHSLNDGKIGHMAYVGPRLSMTATNADTFHHVRPGEERWSPWRFSKKWQSGISSEETVKKFSPRPMAWESKRPVNMPACRRKLLENWLDCWGAPEIPLFWPGTPWPETHPRWKRGWRILWRE